MAYKKIIVEFTMEVDEFDELVQYTKDNSNDASLVTEKNSFRDLIQDSLYDDFGAGGWFNVESVETVEDEISTWQKEKWG